jgi:capsular exopolysaccharide synthesis family protein
LFEDEQQFEQEFERQLSLSDYLRIAYRGRWIILISLVAVFAITVYITFTSPNIYQASTTVLVESSGSMERQIFGADYMLGGGGTTLIPNQTEILKSRRLAERTIRKLDQSVYRDSLSVFQPDAEGNLPSLRGMVGWLQGNMEIEHRKDTDVIEIKFSAYTPFECSYIANVIAQEFKLLNAEKSQGEVGYLRNFLDDQVTKKAEELKLAEDRLRDYYEQNKVASLDAETTQLIQRLAEAESMLETAEVELSAAQETRNSLNGQLEERRSSLGTDLGGISTPYILSLQNQLGEAVGERTKFMIAVESSQNASRISYEGQIKVYDERIKALRDKLDEESKKLKASGMVKDAFEVSQELITSLLKTETEIKAQTAKIKALRDVVSDYETKLESLPEKNLELARLERQRKVQEQTYTMMLSKLEETKITQAGKSGNVSILDEAIAPVTPIKPNKRLNLMLGVLIGLGLGLGIVFVREYFDNTVKTVEEVENLGFNLLGTIPIIEEEAAGKKSRKKWESLEEEGQQIESRLVTHFDPKSPISESYRTLRTNLAFTRVDNPMKTILITSAGPKEGKSTTVSNLAITLAQLGSNVVLVDSDLRRPVVHAIFGMEKEDGLTDHIMGHVPYEQSLKKSLLDNLSIVTSGTLPPNPSELLGSKAMEEFIDRLKKDFDIVLFDSPPVIAVTDAAILCSKVDGAFLVISSGTTNRDAINRAKRLLENVQTQVLGAVLNGVDISGAYGSSNYYYYYHYYYGAHPKRGRRFKNKVNV